MKTNYEIFSRSILALAVSLVVGGAVAVAGPNPLNVAKVFSTYTAVFVPRAMVQQFGQVPANYLPTSSTVKGSKSNTDNVAMPGDWEVKLTTTEGISGEMFHAQQPIVNLNEVARGLNRGSRDYPVNIDQPGLKITIDARGLGSFAIREQGMKVFEDQGGELSILSSTMRLVLVPGANNVVEIRQNDPRPILLVA